MGPSNAQPVIVMKAFCLTCLLLLTHSPGWAESSPDNGATTPKMDNARLGELIAQIAGDFEGKPGYWEFDLEGYQTLVITDENFDRMRIIVPIKKIDGIDGNELLRMMQANFDSALDARYSIARGVLWSAFIHPLSTLTARQFIDGLAQSVNLAATHGTTYSSGALIFSDGDSKGEQNKHYKSIIDRENSI